MGTAGAAVPVFIEAGRTRVFASALDWPGWARRAKTEEQALEALAAYLPRYLPIVQLAGVSPPTGELVVAERHSGVAKNADFGALGEIAASETAPLTAAEADRLARLLEAAWSAFVAGAAAAPAELRKGPRGGGRDTEQIVAHVQEAEAVYARKIGLSRDKSAPDPTTLLRRQIGAALRNPEGLAMPPRGWPLRYGVRRLAWHVLDHLWEIEDKSEPA